MIIAAITAIGKLEIINASPIKEAVINKVIALITNKKNPNVNTVTGKVKMIRTGFKIVLIIASSTLAKMAADMLSI